MQDLCTEKDGNIVERNVFKKPKKNGKTSSVHGLKDFVFLKWQYFPNLSTVSMQSLPKFQWPFMKNRTSWFQNSQKLQETLNGQNDLEKE